MAKSSTMTSRNNLLLNSSATNVSQLRMTNAAAATKTGKENDNRNTFQLASSKGATDQVVSSMNSSFGGMGGITQNTNQQL